ncbi:G2/mitotic-specific cyclin [Coemansia sp. RSA 1813]|nr:G2/mitotic-specific cyclin [Coemansia sp. RSA 986]KAJ2217801.1 G2/mitotic-specific cyclin [Coemansia sp. RSA 487]KAJ2572963.1 G2/mitotic-specific cyclin [Coemansia sp. RSA 1813]
MTSNTRSVSTHPAGAEPRAAAKSNSENGVRKAIAANKVLQAKPSNNARLALASIGASALNTKKAAVLPGKAAARTAKVSITADSKETMAAAAASRKPRIPLAAVDASSRPQVYRDPAPRVARPRVVATQSVTAAVASSLAKNPLQSRPLRILRTTSSSNIAPARQPVKVAAGEQPAKAVDPENAYISAPLAGRKRRAHSAEPGEREARAVRAKVDGLSTQSAEHKKDVPVSAPASAVPTSADSQDTVCGGETQSVCSVESVADSQATAVDNLRHVDVGKRKIARPAKAFSASLRSVKGPTPFDIKEANTKGDSTTAAKEKAEVCDWDDIDAEDVDDPLMVSEYISEIIDYMRDLEDKSMPDDTYMSKQHQLTWEMRRVLVNWLVQIHYQLRMLPETLFLAVNIVDRFLSKRQVSVDKLQLVGLTGLLIACKYEEMTTPHVQDFAYLAGNCYKIPEIMNAEVFILRVLDFDLSYPSPLTFLRRVSKAEQYNMQTRTVAKYLMEICLVDHRMMRFSPSHIAAAGICLARRMLRAGEWDGNLRHFSGFSEEELQPCIAMMVGHMASPLEDEFVYKKYQHKRYLKASLFCREWVARHGHEILQQQPLESTTPPVGHFDSSESNVPSVD